MGRRVQTHPGNWMATSCPDSPFERKDSPTPCLRHRIAKEHTNEVTTMPTLTAQGSLFFWPVRYDAEE